MISPFALGELAFPPSIAIDGDHSHANPNRQQDAGDGKAEVRIHGGRGYELEGNCDDGNERQRTKEHGKKGLVRPGS